MRDISIRTIGATIILAALALIYLTQRPLDPSTTEIGAPAPTTPGFTTITESAEASPSVDQIDYRIGLLAAPSTDNFWKYFGEEPTVWNAYVLGATKPALLAVDSESMSVVPDLALTVAEPVEKDGVWKVKVDLDTDRHWSDGTPITAHDVEFTFGTVRSLGLEGGWTDAYPPSLTDVKANDDGRVVLTFEDRPVLDEWPYGAGLAPIMPAHVWAATAEGAKDPEALYAADAEADVSGGPLEITGGGEGVITASLTEQAGNPGVASVVFSVYEDEDDAVGAIVNGDIDYIMSPSGLSQEAVADLEGRSDVKVITNPANSVRYLGFNLERQPMAEPAFRSALDLVFDRDDAVHDIVPSAEPAYSLIPASNPVWSNTTAISEQVTRHDLSPQERVEEAVRLLRKAGYTWKSEPSVIDGELTPGKGLRIDGQEPAPLTILTTGDKYDSARPAYAAEVEAALEVLGFDVRPVETDFETVVDLAFTPQKDAPRTYDMYILGWTVGNPAHPDFYGDFFVGDGPINSAGYSSDSFGNAWDRYRGATDSAVAYEALWEMEAILAKDLPYLPLYHPMMYEAYRSDRISFDPARTLGGVQGRLGGIEDVKPIS